MSGRLFFPRIDDVFAVLRLASVADNQFDYMDGTGTGKHLRDQQIALLQLQDCPNVVALQSRSADLLHVSWWRFSVTSVCVTTASK